VIIRSGNLHLVAISTSADDRSQFHAVAQLRALSFIGTKHPLSSAAAEDE